MVLPSSSLTAATVAAGCRAPPTSVSQHYYIAWIDSDSTAVFTQGATIVGLFYTKQRAAILVVEYIHHSQAWMVVARTLVYDSTGDSNSSGYCQDLGKRYLVELTSYGEERVYNELKYNS